MNAIQSITQPVSFFALQADKLKNYSLSSHICLHLSGRAKVRFGASNTTKLAGNLPDNEVFLRPELASAGLSRLHDFGRDGLVRKAGRMTNFMLLTSRPPVARSKATSGFQSQLGARTMTKVNTPTTPANGNTSTLARQQAIENALSMALFHIRHGDTQQGIRAATAKAIRAASLLKQACTEIQISGRA